MQSVSVVIPAYNEEKRLPETLQQIQKHLFIKNYDYEIIVVDDGSNDNTAGVPELFPDLKIKLLKNEKNHGKGYCIKKGVFEASKEIVLFSDADRLRAPSAV